jgi:hypothetical protein
MPEELYLLNNLNTYRAVEFDARDAFLKTSHVLKSKLPTRGINVFRGICCPRSCEIFVHIYRTLQFHIPEDDNSTLENEAVCSWESFVSTFQMESAFASETSVAMYWIIRVLIQKTTFISRRQTQYFPWNLRTKLPEHKLSKPERSQYP